MVDDAVRRTDFETPKSGASRRIVRFVRQYAATSRALSSNGRLHGLTTAAEPRPLMATMNREV